MKRIILSLLIVAGLGYADINNPKELNEQFNKQFEENGCKDLKKGIAETDAEFNERIKKCLTIAALEGVNNLKIDNYK